MTEFVVCRVCNNHDRGPTIGEEPMGSEYVYMVVYYQKEKSHEKSDPVVRYLL